MRTAKIGDYLRALDVKLRLLHSIRFDLTDVPALRGVSGSLSLPLCVIAGANGAGKSSLLACFWATVCPSEAKTFILGNSKVNKGRVELEFTEGVQQIASILIDEDQIKVEKPSLSEAFYINSGEDALKDIEALRTFGEISDVLNGVESTILTDDDVREISYITRRDYTKIELYEVELADPAPYFKVSSNGIDYDTRSMGFGEAVAFYTWWAIRRAEKNSIIFLEEPEAYLSHQAQISLFNFIVKSIVTKDLKMVLATHSSSIVNMAPKSTLRFLTRRSDGSCSVIPNPSPASLSSIGIRPHVRGVIFVEDEAAKYFLGAIIKLVDPFLFASVDIEYRNGDGGVNSCLSSLIDSQTVVKFIGVYDGDIRGRVPSKIAGRALYLPGVEPIEKQFKKMVERDCFSTSERFGNPQIPEILSTLQGDDHHDWMLNFVREIGMDRVAVIMRMTEQWFSIKENREAAFELISSISVALESR